MKKGLLKSIAFLGLAVVLLSSCAKVPQAEIDAAKAAIAQADSAEANVYVHESFVALQDSMNSIMVSVEAQKSKLFKKFNAEKEKLTALTVLAGEVKQNAIIKKEELKVEVQNTITEVKALIETNKALIIEAPKGKEGKAAIEAIKLELDAVEISVNEATQLFDAGNYMAANDKVKAAKDKASSINTELTDVIAKYKASKGKK